MIFLYADMKHNAKKVLLFPRFLKIVIASVHLSVMLSHPKPLDEIQPNLVCELLT